MVRSWMLVVVAGCGRIAFDPLGDGGMLGDGAVSEAGLLAYYKLDDVPGDGVLDSTGNGHDGICVSGCPGVGSIAKVGGGSYNFDGASTYIAIADAPSLHPAELTVSAWINVTALGNQSFVQKPFGTGTANSWEIFMSGAGGIRVCSTTQCVNPSPTITANAWHHIAFVATTTQQTCYVDGAAQGFSPSALAWDGNDVLIGADRDNGTPLAFVNGRIDDVRIYGRALSATEIAALAAP